MHQGHYAVVSYSNSSNKNKMYTALYAAAKIYSENYSENIKKLWNNNSYRATHIFFDWVCQKFMNYRVKRVQSPYNVCNVIFSSSISVYVEICSVGVVIIIIITLQNIFRKKYRSHYLWDIKMTFLWPYMTH